jgi:hypothetical protein
MTAAIVACPDGNRGSVSETSMLRGRGTIRRYFNVVVIDTAKKLEKSIP